ncbi:MAG: pyridoxamine 5-phosphate oxidase [Phycisphaerales bacterium]|jgi:pyridoxamine 5'-phosphate oxidase|nr:pyridoxamine 5-phosphate oxidase [Phycisphaerales bacterium]
MSDPTPNVPANQLRREYTRAFLLEKDILPDPIQQFDRWFTDATNAAVTEANAMTLATADAQTCAPSVRVVLLKGFDERGFVFYTNYASRKGRELAANPRAALCFYWQPLERQVRIEGTIEKVPRAESEAYFHSRPIGAQIGAWVSHQSDVLESREELDRRDRELLKKFAGRPVPLPDNWGGIRVVPSVIEFWQGRPSRLHDRIEYRRNSAGDAWQIRRLAP